MQHLGLNGIFERHIILLRFLPEASDLVIPARLGVRFTDQHECRIRLQPLAQFDEYTQILTDKLFTEAAKWPP